MNRRSFLEGLGYLSLAGVLSSCGSSSGQQISVEILRRSLPVQLLRRAKQSLSPKTAVRISTSHDVAELYGQLQRWNALSRQDLKLCGLGDYWLTQAIQSELIEPLALPDAALKRLPDPWLALVQRDVSGMQDPAGKIWGAPYRWGATVLIYRKDKLKKLGWELRDWDDLWKSDLQGRVGLLDQPREVIGMTLKTLGQSYNEPDPKQQPDLQSKLRSLHQQTRLYSSQNYIEPLILGDIWVAMGWSSDVLPSLSQDPNLGVIFPASGSSVWADVWVNSKKSAADSTDFPAEQLMAQWIEYWWSEEGARDITKFTNAASVIPVALEEERNQAMLTPQNLSVSEFLLPLSPETIAQYRALWLQMRKT